MSQRAKHEWARAHWSRRDPNSSAKFMTSVVADAAELITAELAADPRYARHELAPYVGMYGVWRVVGSPPVRDDRGALVAAGRGLAGIAGQPASAVRTQLLELERDGYLQIHRRRAHRLPSVYILAWPIEAPSRQRTATKRTERARLASQPIGESFRARDVERGGSLDSLSEVCQERPPESRRAQPTPRDRRDSGGRGAPSDRRDSGGRRPPESRRSLPPSDRRDSGAHLLRRFNPGQIEEPAPHTRPRARDARDAREDGDEVGGGRGSTMRTEQASDRGASDRSTAPAPRAASSGVELPPRTLAVIAAAPAETAADPPPEEPPPAIPDWRAHLERTPADIDEAAKCWARAFELRLGVPLAPNERPKLDEVAVYLWALADSSSRPWSAVARRALDALFADSILPTVRHPGGWARAHMATIADLITGDAPIPNTLDLDAMREREASAHRRKRGAASGYQRAAVPPEWLTGPSDFGDGPIPQREPSRVIPYGGGPPSSLRGDPVRSEDPGALSLAAWAGAIRGGNGTPPPPSAEDMRHHAEVTGLARDCAGDRPVETVLEDWAARWYRWAEVATANSWCTWARAAAAGKAPRGRRGFVEAGTDFTDWGDADIVAGSGS